MKILIAEDDPVSCKVLEARLANWGYDVVVTRDGNEAWQALQDNDAPRLAIFDWMMPGIDGVEVCQRVRKDSEKPYTYIILLTVLDEVENLVLGMEAGADDYIRKPVNANELRVRLRAGKRMIELQDELIAAREVLRESEGRLKTILESIQAGVLIIDPVTHHIIEANAMACKLIGAANERVVGAECWQYICPAKMGACPITDMGQAVDNLECLLLAASGERRAIIKTVTTILLGGKPHLLESFIDNTERKHAEDEVLKLNRELKTTVEERTKQLLEAQEELVRKEKLAIIGQFSGSVGHELRNPLGVMNNAIYFLKSAITDANETVKEYLDIIKDEIDKSQRVITDLLDFARTRTPQVEVVMVCALMEETLGRCSVPENVEIRTDIPATLPMIRVDPMQIGQVFANLIRNALQVMQKGGTLQIAARHVRGSETGSCRVIQGHEEFIEISITDTGSGISPENMKKLFHPLFTTKVNGIGLGLTVCKHLTEANGGRVEVESELGKGATFTVTLPIDG